MININEAYPNSEQFEEFNATDNCIFKKLKECFFKACEESPLDKIHLLKADLKRYEKYANQTYTKKYYYEGICLTSMLDMGWINFEVGEKTVKNDGYKRCPEIVAQILEQFKETAPPSEFFEGISIKSMAVYHFGMGYSQYYHWLEGEIESENINKGTLLPPQAKTPIIEQYIEGPKLSMKQIALKYVYEGKGITKENCNEIVKQYGHNSGQKLYQEYGKFIHKTNRTGRPTPATPKKFENKIYLIGSVIDILEAPYKQRAIDELSILEMNYKNEDE